MNRLGLVMDETKHNEAPEQQQLEVPTRIWVRNRRDTGVRGSTYIQIRDPKNPDWFVEYVSLKEYESLQQQLQSADLKSADWRSDYAEITEERDALKQQIESLQQQYNDLTAIINDDGSLEGHEAIVDICKDMNHAYKKISDVVGQLETETRRHKNVVEVATAWKNTADAATSELEQVKAELSRIYGEYRLAIQRTDSQQLLVDKLQAENTRLTDQLEDLRFELTKCALRCAELYQQNKEKESRYE